ncbi:MAG TPA: hypothetical protein DCM04_07830 [Saprospirales bacterium]|nr:hypothetical protein [Saprospirales bacterium]
MMKIIFSLLLALCASTCYAHGGWKPCVEQAHPNVPYPYPQVVVPAQPVQTLTTFPTPMIYYQWTPYYVLEPVRPNYFVLFPKLHTKYVPTIRWVNQQYYSY